MSEKRKEELKAIAVIAILVGFAITIAVIIAWWIGSLAGG